MLRRMGTMPLPPGRFGKQAKLTWKTKDVEGEAPEKVSRNGKKFGPWPWQRSWRARPDFALDEMQKGLRAETTGGILVATGRQNGEIQKG
jgi:hypothetical protein